MMSGKIACHWEAKLCVARRAFKHDELRIHLFNRDELAMGHTSGIRESGAKHSPPGHPGAPDCPRPHPQQSKPETPLTLDISAGNL